MFTVIAFSFSTLLAILLNLFFTVPILLAGTISNITTIIILLIIIERNY